MNNNSVTFTNFRDLGSLSCPGGRVIKAGKIYRAPKLVPKTRADKEYIASLGLNSVIDLRSFEEAQESPDILPEGVKYLFAPALKEGVYPHIIVTKTAKRLCLKEDRAAAVCLYEEKRRSYREMPFAKDAYSTVFECLDRGETLLFHCTEGKDRTGIAAALVELALGRTREQATEEYLRSNILRPGKNRKPLRLLGFSRELINAINYAEHTHRELLESSFDEMIKHSGSIKDFLAQFYGITEERTALWREIYTETV